MEIMKKTIKKAGKICLVMFCIAIAILVGYAFMSKEEVIEVPTVIGIYLLLTSVAILICMSLAFVFDVIENMRRDKVSYIKELLRMAVIYFVIFVGVDYLGNGNKPGLQTKLISAFVVVCIWRAGKYLYEK